MRVAWANEVAHKLAEDVRIGGHHCFSALWKRRDRCPDCLSLLAFRTGEAQDGIRERGRPGQQPEAYRVRSVPVFDRSGSVQWVAEVLVALPWQRTETPHPLHPPPETMSRRSGAALVVVDIEDRIVSWSPAAEAMLGYSVEEALGRRVDLLLTSDNLDEERVIASKIAEQGHVPRFESVRRARDGRIVPVAVCAEALRDEREQVIGRTCWLEDLSAVERLRRRVAEQDRMLAHITHAVDDAIVGIDVEGVVRSWNRGAERWFGRAARDVLGTSLAGLVGAEGLSYLLERVRRDTVIQSMRMRWRDAEGESVPVDVSARLMRGEDDTHDMVALVARDLSERLRLERQIVRSEKMAVVGSLAAGLAHEIGTPLNIISAKAEYLMLDAPNEQQRKELEGIVAETDRISRLVRELLTFARGERRGLVEVDLAATVQRVIALTSIALDKKRILTQVDIDPALPAIPIEPDGLHQLLLNLLLNAVAAVGEGGHIGIAAQLVGGTGGQTVVVEVHDDGPGVPDDLVDRIFDPFFTTRPDGTGLGLTVCERIVSTHGGDIRVGRGPLGGARFAIQLPLRPEGTR